jgi:uncharacterized SAM-dependent methyltransferase
MLPYYKSRVEVANEFKISEGTVRNWIKRTVAKELNLELVIVKDKYLIVRNLKNHAIMEKLAQDGQKFKPLENREVIIVPESSCKHLTIEQKTSLIVNLEVDKSISQKFNYLNHGSEYWNALYKTSLEEGTYTMALSDLYFFENAFNLINDQFSAFEKINIVDIGIGDGNPVLPLLKKLQALNKLNSYTGLDISKTMISQASETIKANNINVPCYYHVVDIENQSLQNILYNVKYSTSQTYPTLVLFLGGTLTNQANIIHTGSNVTDGLLPEDRLVITNGFTVDIRDSQKFASKSSDEDRKFVFWFVESLGLINKFVSYEKGYNQHNQSIELSLILKQDTEIRFTNPNKALIFNKGDKIKILQNKRDTFATISKLADDLHLNLKMIIKHPNYNNIMYMMGKG